MTQIIKKSVSFVKMLLIVGLLTQIDMSFAAVNPYASAPATDISNASGSFRTTVESVVAWVIGFLYLIAVIFGIYAGFLILTAGGDEEKVKKGKSTMINVVIGLIVIFFSSVIINWIITTFVTGTAVTVA